MGWLAVAGLGIVWAAFLLPTRRLSPNRSVEDFERNMDLLADTGSSGSGRYIITPRKGVAFVGPRERAKERARERRRRVFVFLLESIGLSFLIGLVPPLRLMWYATAILAMALGAYVWLLVSIRARAGAGTLEGTRGIETPERARPQRARYATDAGSRTARPAFDGLMAMGADEFAQIVVRPRESLARV